MGVILDFLGELFVTLLAGLPTGRRTDRRWISEGRVRSGLRAAEGRVLNMGTEWSTGICEITPRRLHFAPSMGIVGPRTIDVLSVYKSDLDFENAVLLQSHPTTTLIVSTEAGSLYWQVSTRVADEAIARLGTQGAR